MFLPWPCPSIMAFLFLPPHWTAQNVERSMENFVAKLKASKSDWVTVCETEGKRVGLAAIQLSFFAEQIRKPSAGDAVSSSGGGSGAGAAAGAAAGAGAGAGADAAVSLALATVPPPPPTPAEQRTALQNRLREACEEKRKLGGRKKNKRVK